MAKFVTALFQGDIDRNNVKLLTALIGVAERPFLTCGPVAEEFVDVGYNTCHIDNGMTAEDLGEALGQIAGQATARTFMEVEFHGQFLSIAPSVDKFDVIGTFACITKQGFEKIIATFFGEDLLQDLCRKECIYCFGIHGWLTGLRLFWSVALLQGKGLETGANHYKPPVVLVNQRCRVRTTMVECCP